MSKLTKMTKPFGLGPSIPVPRMTWLSGAGSILALFGNYYEYNRSSTEAQADALAIYSDWLNTGNDIRTALDKCILCHKKSPLSPASRNKSPKTSSRIRTMIASCALSKIRPC